MSKQERQERLDRQRRAGLRKLTLTEFLAARLDEDEAAAKAAPGCRWQSHAEDDIAGASVYDEQWLLLYPESYDHDNALSNKPGAAGPMYIQRARDELAAHIARHDPARVLREVEAKRKILADLPAYSKQRRELRDHMYLPENAGYHSGHADGTDDASRYVLRQLATVYSDHPDYDEAWRT